MPAHDSSLLALFTRFAQDTRLLRLTTPLGADLLAECVRGEEAISRGYCVHASMRCRRMRMYGSNRCSASPHCCSC